MRVILVAVLALFLVAACSTPPDREDAGAAGEKKAAAVEYEGDTVRFITQDMMLEASYLSPERLSLYYSIFRGGYFPNPFPPSPYIVFSLTLENKSSQRLSFNPGMAFLITSLGEPFSAMGYVSLYTDLSAAKVEDVDDRMEAFKASCFDTAVNIEPGERMQRLLVFKRKKNVKDSASLVLRNLYLGKDVKTALFDFKKGLGLKKPADD